MKRKFDEIAEELQGMIDRKEYTDRLPSEQELAQRFKTASATVRKSLDILQARGIIRKVPYVGTFVHRESRRKVRIFWRQLFLAEYDQGIRNAVQSHFRDFDVEFCADIEELKIVECDLIRTPATTSLSFSDYVLPLPLEIIEKYRNEEYFQEPFRAHKLNSFHYAVPILFSPSLLLLNKKLLAGFGRTIGHYDFTWDLLLELQEFSRKKGIVLYTRHGALNLLRTLIFSDTVNGGLQEIDIKKLKWKISKVWPLFDWDIPAASAETLVTWSCRQALTINNEFKNYQMVVNPVFYSGETPWNLITGEFLMLSSCSKVQAEAIQVMEYMLSPEVQRIIGKYKLGLPVLKSAAADSINSRYYRDDIFLNEIPNMLVNNASEQEFLIRLSTFSSSILDGEMTEEQFTGYLEYEINMAHRKTAGKNNILQQHTLELAGL